MRRTSVGSVAVVVLVLAGCSGEADASLPESFDTAGTVLWEQHDADGSLETTVQSEAPVLAVRIHLACTRPDEPGELTVTTPVGGASVACPATQGRVGLQGAGESDAVPAGDFPIRVEAPPGARWSVTVTSVGPDPAD